MKNEKLRAIKAVISRKIPTTPDLIKKGGCFGHDRKKEFRRMGLLQR